MTAGVSLLAAVLALGFLSVRSCGSKVSLMIDFHAYFCDTVTGEFFDAPWTKLSPFLNEAGHECVRVYFYTCGTCTEQEKFLGYYEKFTPELKHLVETTPDGINRFYREIAERTGILVSLDGKTWLAGDSEQAKKLIQDRLARCPGGRTHHCLPRDCPTCPVPTTPRLETAPR